MTGCHSEPQARNLSVAFSLSVGERKLMNHFVVSFLAALRFCG
jgi:hypothetical protein